MTYFERTPSFKLSMHSSVGSRIHLWVVLAFLGLGGAASGCKDPTAMPEPASVSADQLAIADGTAGLVMTTPPTFVVKDAGGNELTGVRVSIAVTAGGGTLTDAPSSTKSGGTPVGTWKLGTVAGLNSVTVTVGSLPPLVITVNGNAGPPASIVFVAGDNQFSLAGTPVPVTPVAMVRDQFANGVSGVPVTFSVGLGAGVVSSTPVVSDAGGNAPAPTWTLGKSAEAQSLRAFAGGFAATVSAVVQSDYNVDVRFFGPPMQPVASAAFTTAAARVRGAMIGDVLDTTVPVNPVNLEACGITGVTAFQESVDDVVIYAAVATIDGPGKVLAFAGPCVIRGPANQPNRQTVVGVMKFDAADLDTLIARGTLTDVIQHEMFHVVGIGTLWSTYRVIAGAGTLESRFIGNLGVGACVAIGGASVCPGSVPVENSGGSGTADGHWRETVFATELMTGFVTRPTPGFTGILNPLSTITVQSLADIGYIVNPAAADPYAIPGFALSGIRAQMNVDNSSEWEQLVRPQMELTRLGTIVAIRNQ